MTSSRGSSSISERSLSFSLCFSPPRGSATNETFSLRWIYRRVRRDIGRRARRNQRFARRGPVSRANRCLVDTDPAIGIHAFPSKGIPFDVATSLAAKTRTRRKVS